MKIKELKEMLEKFDDNDEVVIQTQKGHSLYGDIASADYYEEDSDGEKYEESNIVVIQFYREGYSPKQALER